MATKEINVTCPVCQQANISKQGIKNQKQIYRCENPDCPKKYFSESYKNKGWDPQIRSQVLKMTANGKGTRAIARILDISPTTVTAILKEQESRIWQVNYNYINKHFGKKLSIDIISAEQIEVKEVEMDEMWSFVHDKSQQCWLWWAIDHDTGEPLAFCFGTRAHKHLDELLDLLSAFQLETIYVDGNYAYEARFPDEVVPGKRNTQKIERKHLSLRTWCSRLVRKGIRFSKTHRMHAIVVGFVINIWFFCRNFTEFVI